MQHQDSPTHRTLHIGFLMQSGFNLSHNAGPKINAAALMRAMHSIGHYVSMMSLQPSRHIVELTHDQPEPVQKALGVSGSKPFQLLEKSIRFPQKKFGLPYLGLFDSFRFREACLKHLSACDLFHERYSPMSFGGVWAAKKLAKPLVLEIHADIINMEMPLHGKPTRGVQHYLAELITRYCFTHANKIISISNALSHHLQIYWKVPANKIVTIPNATEITLFTEPTDHTATRARWGIGDAPVVIFTGSFQPWHGVDFLVAAFTRVAREIPAARLLLVGDGKLRTDIEAQVAAAGLDNKIIFTGSVEHQAIPDLLSIADVAVAPYTKLPAELWFSPLKLFEYMAAGKAIVASHFGQIAEVIEDGRTGLLVEPDNVDMLAASIIRLLKDTDFKHRLGHNAHTEAVEKHSWAARARTLENVFFSVLTNDTSQRTPSIMATPKRLS